MEWFGEWREHDWEVWEYSVSHAQLHVRGIPSDDPGGPCVELLFKSVHRLATSTMSWSGLAVGLRRTTEAGHGVFVLTSLRTGPHTGHGVVRAGSLHHLEGAFRYPESVTRSDSHTGWHTLWTR